MHRHRLRSLLTIASGAISFIVLVLSLQNIFGLRETLWQAPGEGLLVVVFLVFLFGWRLRDLDPLARAEGLRRFVLSALFVLVLAAPLAAQLPFLGRSATVVAGQLAAAEQDTGARVLAVVRGFPAAYEDYLKREFRLPHWFVQLNALVKVHLLRVSPNNNIALGTDGFYFEGMGTSRVEGELVESFDNIADYMGQAPFTEAELLQWKIALEQRRYWLQQQGSEYVFVLAPTKAFVYPEHLPASLQRVRGRSRYEQLSSYLREHADIPFIDLLPPLLAAKARADYPPLFYKTDFHWNFYGAFVAYRAIVDQLARFFPRYPFPAPELADFDMRIDRHWAHESFMYMLGLPLFLHRNEHHITMVPRPGGPYDTALDLPPGGIYDHYPPLRPITGPDGTTMEVRLLRNPGAPLPSIALLGDSFLEKCIYFYSANARRVLNHRTVVNFPKEIFFYEQPTIVIQEILNMFILRPPPKNPWRLGAHYVEEKFRRNADRVLLRREVAPAARRVELAGLPAGRPGEVRVAAVTFAVETGERLDVRLLDQAGREAGVRGCRVRPDSPVCQILLPNEVVALEVVAARGRPPARAAVGAVEVRSDVSGP